MFDQIEFFLRYGVQPREPRTATLIFNDTEGIFGVYLPSSLVLFLRDNPEEGKRLYDDPRLPRDG